MMSKAQIEKRWGVYVDEDGIYWKGQQPKPMYKIYSADGCQWENGLTSIKSVEAECRKWNDALLAIKRDVESALTLKARRR